MHNKFNTFLLLSDIKKIYKFVIFITIYIIISYIFKFRICPINYITGLPCPACGITRALFMFLKGNIIESIYFHPFFLIILIYSIYFFIGRYFINIPLKNLQNIFTVIGVFMIIFYIYRIIIYFPHTEPLAYNYNSFLYYIYSKL